MKSPISETIKQTAGLVHEGGEFGDKLFTSKEEEMIQENKFAESAVMMHKNDMLSDSWLSKNVRPLSLAWAMIESSYIATFILIGIFKNVTFPDGFFTVVSMLIGKNGLIIAFYFPGRTKEKGFAFEPKKAGFFDRFRS